jgi:dinuclear metal center YbgI/SA1388 family protein
MKLSDLCYYLDNVIPLSFQESYDNSGLQCGSPDAEIKSALIAFDITDKVLSEAETSGCDIIISHHPLIFKEIKSITGRTDTERLLIRAIKRNIAIYSAHTNLDAFSSGVSRKMADRLGLKKVTVLSPLKGRLLKLVTFIPESHIDKVREAIFRAGAGVIGNYDCCGFAALGRGSFRGNENTNPFVGEKGKIHFENEIRFETILYSHLKNRVVKSLIDSHPYEEVAYDLYPLENTNIREGFGCIGELPEARTEGEFLKEISIVFSARGIRYSNLTGKMVRRVALCGGSGSSLMNDAISSGADIYITADVKYHTFFEADNRILLADIGHYESENCAKEILYDLIIKKFPKFALRFSEVNTNPINYL